METSWAPPASASTVAQVLTSPPPPCLYPGVGDLPSSPFADVGAKEGSSQGELRDLGFPQPLQPSPPPTLRVTSRELAPSALPSPSLVAAASAAPTPSALAPPPSSGSAAPVASSPSAAILQSAGPPIGPDSINTAPSDTLVAPPKGSQWSAMVTSGFVQAAPWLTTGVGRQ
uniref:Uncharacterized protein n=1 Tax=Arundo donax TaxID=35708 RepID=A0A0A8ZSS3_ARUDO